MAKRRILKVGIIGQGRSGYGIHASWLRRDTRRYKIVAVVDPIEERREKAVAEFGCDAYESHKEMLKRDDLDLVVNATPSHLHVPVSLDVLKAGFNLVCEKPLARKVKEVDKLMAAAKKSGKVFVVFQQSRFAPYFEQVRKVIDSGVLGRIVMIKIAFNGFSRRWDWQTLQEYYGGNLLNTGPHPLDQALQLFGDGMPKVTCLMDRALTFGDAEDHVKLLLSGKNNPAIDLEISSCCAYPVPLYQVYGTRGGLVATQKEASWKYFNPKTAPKQKLIREPLVRRNPDGSFSPVYCSEKLKMTEKHWTLPKSKSDLFTVMSGRYYKHLYETLTEGKPMPITLEQVRKQIAVIEECHKQNPLSRLKK